jgi:hypothetical protein
MLLVSAIVLIILTECGTNAYLSFGRVSSSLEYLSFGRISSSLEYPRKLHNQLMRTRFAYLAGSITSMSGVEEDIEQNLHLFHDARISSKFLHSECPFSR